MNRRPFSRGAKIALIVAGMGVSAALFSMSVVSAQSVAVASTTQGTDQQIINNYQCYGGGNNSVTICMFNSINYNLACNVSTVNAAKNLKLLSKFFRLNPDARLQDINQQQWQQIMNNYQCYGGGDNAVTICTFNSANYNIAGNLVSTSKQRDLLTDLKRLYPDAKRINADTDNKR